MVLNGGRFFHDSSAGFLYIPALSLAYIYSLEKNELFLIFGVLSLASAVFHHGLLRAIWGPKGFKEEHLSREEKRKRILAAIWDVGAAEDYPADLIDGILNSEHRSRSRYYILVFLSIATVGLFSGYLASFVYLFLNIGKVDYIGLILFFLLLLWLLQNVLWVPWSSVFMVEKRLEERPEPGEYLREEMHRFGYFIREESNLTGTHLDYLPDNGGEFHIEFESGLNPGEVKSESIDTIAQGYVAFIERVDMPIERLNGYIKYDGGNFLQFLIETEWAELYAEDELEYPEYLEKISESMEFNKNED